MIAQFATDTRRAAGGRTRRRSIGAVGLAVPVLLAMAGIPFAEDEQAAGPVAAIDGAAVPGMVRCANLIYGDNKTSVCFSAAFLKRIASQTHVVASPEFSPVKAEAADLYNFPFTVMTGEGPFTLTEPQRLSLRNYLTNGGFLVASAGCSSVPWAVSFRAEIELIFPELSLEPLDPSHPLFHTVHDIGRLKCKSENKTAELEGLEIDGKIVVVFSSDGLNDTANAGGDCCCCGGNEIRNAQDMNVNLLAYALTH